MSFLYIKILTGEFLLFHYDVLEKCNSIGIRYKHKGDLIIFCQNSSVVPTSLRSMYNLHKYRFLFLAIWFWVSEISKGRILENKILEISNFKTHS